MTTTDQDLLGRLGETWWKRRHPEWARSSTRRLPPRLHLSARQAPRYVFDRLTVRARTRVRGPQPWITDQAREVLDQLLRPSDRGLEFGSGDTTWFFAERVAFVYSVEGVDSWYDLLAKSLAERGLDNVALSLASSVDLGYETEAHRAAYVGVYPELEPGSLDFVFVDGEYRDACALRGLRLLRPGGLFILDNAETYLPSSSRSPWQMEAPATPGWQEFVEATRDWRRVWTTNGVWDTAIWIKP